MASIVHPYRGDKVSELSRLSLSKPSSSLVTGRDPLCLSGGSLGGVGSISYPAWRSGTWSEKHEHKIVFNGGDKFTVDGQVRDANDPKNAAFLESLKWSLYTSIVSSAITRSLKGISEFIWSTTINFEVQSIKNYELPEEFGEDGVHMIRVDPNEDVSKEYIEQFRSLMSIEM